MFSRKRVIFLFTIILLFHSGMSHVAVANRKQNVGIPFPVVKRDTLLNGLQLLTVEQAGTGSISLRVRINSGALFDLAGKGGLADVTSAMLLQGGGNYNASSLKSTIEGLGLHLRIVPDWDAIDVEFSGPSDAAEIMFDLLGAILITPTFDAKDLEAVKAQHIAAIKNEKSDAAEINRKAMEIVFGSHPFGRPLQGTSESIQQITKADLVYFHKKFFLANNAVLIASGDLTAEQVTKFSRSKLGAWKKGDKVAPTFRPPEIRTARSIVVLDRPQLQESKAVIGQVGISRRSQDYFAVLVLNEILKAKYAMPQNKRVIVEFHPQMVDSPYWIQVAAPVSDMVNTINEIISTMTQMQEALASVELVEAAKAAITTKFTEQLKAKPADALFDIELYGLGRDYLVNYVDRVNAITAADVQRAAKTYLKPQTNTIVIAGPAKLFETELKKIGSVIVSAEPSVLK